MTETLLRSSISNNTNVLTLLEERKCVYVCAPMVRYSKLQFRNLVRQFNCDLCYTPMILADSFCKSAKARYNEFSTALVDTPLIAQFAANTVHDFVGAANMVAPYCSGVDLNCGCPQRWAKQMGVGCCLMDQSELVSDIILQCRNQIAKPFTVSAKIRLGKSSKHTVELCRRLEKAGISFISVHGRTASQQSGSVNSEMIQLVNESVNCPVIANGDVKTLDDCCELQRKTNCKGVMVANGLLTNPTLFTGTNRTTLQCVQQWIDICFNSTLDLNTFNTLAKDATLLRSIPEKPPNLTFQCFHHHLVFMLEKVLPRKDRQIFNNLQTFSDVLEFLRSEFNIVPQVFNAEDYFKMSSETVDYGDLDEVYHTLQNQMTAESEENKGSNEYSYDKHNGSYFESKVGKNDNSDYDLFELFIEDG